jgi:MtN3 and saliva related transmembrane protein
MFDAETIGLIAAALTTISFLPQVIRVIRTNDTAAISLWMYALFVTGIALWGVYGWMIASRPVVISNIVTFALAAFILAQKVRHTLDARPASKRR